MANSNKSLNDSLRIKFLKVLEDFLRSQDEDVLITGSGELTIPTVDADGNEKYVQFIVKVPTGSRDGTPFDGYEVAEDYALKLKTKAATAAEREKKKAAKIERDKAAREAKAKAKAEARAKAEAEIAEKA